jgi:hypothetical protein
MRVLTFLIILFTIGCSSPNGYYSTEEDSDIESVEIGTNELCELYLSANRIGDTINVIL